MDEKRWCTTRIGLKTIHKLLGLPTEVRLHAVNQVDDGLVELVMEEVAMVDGKFVVEPRCRVDALPVLVEFEVIRPKIVEVER